MGKTYLVNEKHLYAVWVEYQCETQYFFKKVQTKQYSIEFLNYCSESDISERYKDFWLMKEKYIYDLAGDWKVLSAEIKYRNADKEFTFSQLTSKLKAEDFLQFCKDNLITTVIVQQ